MPGRADVAMLEDRHQCLALGKVKPACIAVKQCEARRGALADFDRVVQAGGGFARVLFVPQGAHRPCSSRSCSVIAYAGGTVITAPLKPRRVPSGLIASNTSNS